MIINIRNKASISNKYVRFIKWKLRKIDSRFKRLIYSDVFISSEGKKPVIYKATVKLEISGKDIFISKTSFKLRKLFTELNNCIKMSLGQLNLQLTR